jgi:hypothetical protein
MKHYTEDELVLYYYGETDDRGEITRHFDSCAECVEQYRAIRQTLEIVNDYDIPERMNNYGSEVWQRLRDHLPEGGRSGPVRLGGGHLGILIWLSPLLYPVAVEALFYNAALARQIGAMGIVLLLLSLFWALSGPFFALHVLNRLQRIQVDAAWHRAIVYGALVAAVSPPLLLLLRNTGLGLVGWYGAIALIGASTLLPVTESKNSNNRLRRVHRISALLIATFAFVHIANHVCAFINLPLHTTVLNEVRLAYRYGMIEPLLILAVAVQVSTGGIMVWRSLLRGTQKSRNPQILSGLYLGVFFIAHLTAVFIARSAGVETNFMWAAGIGGVLADPHTVYLLPYYVLGVFGILCAYWLPCSLEFCGSSIQGHGTEAFLYRLCNWRLGCVDDRVCAVWHACWAAGANASGISAGE